MNLGRAAAKRQNAEGKRNLNVFSVKDAGGLS